MEAFKTLILIVNIFSSLAIIGLVLMQHGRGADAGASFGGSGSAQGVFGSGGNANFLSRMTGIAATVFFASCLLLGYVHSQRGKSGVDFSNIQQSQTAPAVESKPVAVQDTLSVPATAASAASASETAKPESKESSFSAGEAALAGAAGAAAAKIAADKVSPDKEKKTAAEEDSKKESKSTAKSSSKKTDKKPSKSNSNKK